MLTRTLCTIHVDRYGRLFVYLRDSKQKLGPVAIDDVPKIVHDLLNPTYTFLTSLRGAPQPSAGATSTDVPAPHPDRERRS